MGTITSLNKTAVRDIEVISENEIWYATFGMGLFLQNPGTFTTINAKDGLDVGGMTFDLVKNGKGICRYKKWSIYI